MPYPQRVHARELGIEPLAGLDRRHQLSLGVVDHVLAEGLRLGQRVAHGGLRAGLDGQEARGGLGHAVGHGVVSKDLAVLVHLHWAKGARLKMPRAMSTPASTAVLQVG